MDSASSDLLWRNGRATEPLLGAIADSGQLARLAAREGVDFLLALSAGVYRALGVSALAACLPYRNSNDLMEAHLRESVLPSAGETLVIAGVMASDPTCSVRERLDRLKSWGVRGVTNYPTVTLLDGMMRNVFESEGCTVDAEIALLTQARQCGLDAVAFTGTDPDVAVRFAACGVNALIVSPGQTRQFDDIHERRDRLQQAIRELNVALKAVRSKHPTLPCLVFGGPISLPEDLELVYRQTSFDGFVGGSVFGRYPVESSVMSTFRRFKSVRIPSADPGEAGLGPMIGSTDIMRRLFGLIRRVATCDLNVCIEGESGVGKELVATHIHQLSGRSHGTLVTLNCGAIPDSLLESELFGHERGAFTGADHRRLGKFELAHQGTLFLDEVGDLSPRGQVALLRAIQQREITRVGGDRSIAVNVRVLAASNQPLAALVEQGKFRADLYYRLNNVALTVPPLRDRLDDIPALLVPILATLRVQMGRAFLDVSPQFRERLRQHWWPGNLRELQHVIAQAALLEDEPLLKGKHFVAIAAPAKKFAGAPVASLAEAIAGRLKTERREQVQQALHAAKGNKSRAAELLGVSRKTLYAWLHEWDVVE